MLDAATANTACLVPARNLAAALARLATATTALTTAEAEHADILGRIRHLEAHRATIIERRQRGVRQDDDGAQLALIAADLEGLSTMRTEAEAAIEAARGPVADVERAVETARYVLGRAEDEMAEAALVAHAKQCDTILLQTISELNGLQKRLNRGPPAWAPSRLLADELRRLQIQRGAG